MAWRFRAGQLALVVPAGDDDPVAVKLSGEIVRVRRVREYLTGDMVYFETLDEHPTCGVLRACDLEIENDGRA